MKISSCRNKVDRQSIMADPNWNNGDYYAGEKPDLGLAVARMIECRRWPDLLVLSVNQF